MASRRRRRAWPLILLALTACVTHRVAPRSVTAAAGSGTQDVETLVRFALALDAAGDRQADTLYAPDALVVGNARVRVGAPRYAGVTPGSGRVLITAANATVEGRVAWAFVDYRWSNPAERRVEVGRVTFICERRGDGWKIVHAHSSQPLPWEAGP
jgi:ketosteroid isomerase-like protein